jgi:protein TonB
MTQSANNEYRAPETLEDNAAPTRRGVSPVLLVLLAFALTTAALVWMAQHRQVSQQAATSAPIPAPTMPAADTSRERPAQAAVASKPKKAVDRVAATNRQPRAMAGNVEPKYPASMLRAGVGGTVVVMAELDANGNPVDVKIAERSGERELDRAALNAVRQWRFEPALRNGKAVASSVRVPVDFKPSDLVATQ